MESRHIELNKHTVFGPQHSCLRFNELVIDAYHLYSNFDLCLYDKHVDSYVVLNFIPFNTEETVKMNSNIEQTVPDQPS